MTTFAIVTVYTTEVENTGRLMERNKQDYCNRHGYAFECVRHSLDPSKHPMWSKFLALQEANKKGYTWLFWSDGSDTLIMNPSLTLQSIVDKYPGSEVIATKDRYTGLNNGNFFLRCGDRVANFLQRCIDGYTTFKSVQHPDQSAMADAIREHKMRVLWAPKQEFNSYIHPWFGHQYEEGDFLIHFAGFRGSRLFHLMQHFSLPRYRQLRSIIDCSQTLFGLVLGLWIVHQPLTPTRGVLYLVLAFVVYLLSMSVAFLL